MKEIHVGFEVVWSVDHGKYLARCTNAYPEIFSLDSCPHCAFTGLLDKLTEKAKEPGSDLQIRTNKGAQ